MRERDAKRRKWDMLATVIENATKRRSDQRLAGRGESARVRGEADDRPAALGQVRHGGEA